MTGRAPLESLIATAYCFDESRAAIAYCVERKELGVNGEPREFESPPRQLVHQLAEHVAFRPSETDASSFAIWASVLPLGLVAAYFGSSLQLLGAIACYLIVWTEKSHRDHARAMRGRCHLSSHEPR